MIVGTLDKFTGWNPPLIGPDDSGDTWQMFRLNPPSLIGPDDSGDTWQMYRWTLPPPSLSLISPDDSVTTIIRANERRGVQSVHLLSVATIIRAGSLGGPLSKLCVTPPFSINFRCQIENQASDYRLLGASSWLKNHQFWELYLSLHNNFSKHG
jgi:hypothetical protein